MWAVDTRARIQRFFAEVRTGFETFYDLLINGAKSWANEWVGVFETAVNMAIRAMPDEVTSRLGISSVNLPQPFETQSPQSIINENRRGLNRRRRSIGEQRQEDRGDIQRQLAQTLQALQNTEQTTTVEVDGRELARTQRAVPRDWRGEHRPGEPDEVSWY